MQQEQIFIPLLMQVGLTLAVWIWMFYIRLGEIFRLRIETQRLTLKRESDELLKNSARSSDNLINLFELPVLFYLLILTLYQLQLVNDFYLTLCYLFVAFRILHSLIHVSYNNVTQRFTAYIISSICLWLAWSFAALDIMQQI